MGFWRTVPHFVPHLHQNPSQLVEMGKESKSPVLARKINTIANYRTQQERCTPQLLTEGLLIRILPDLSCARSETATK